MILEIENWYLGYSQILSDCRGGASENNGDNNNNNSVVFLVCSPNVDALATAWILAYMLMLRNDGVSYHLLPCRVHRQ